MKRNKFIALFLLLVICIQVLPLKQTISWLLGNQITEEVLHSVGDEKGKSGRFSDDLFKHFLPTQSPLLVYSPVSISVSSRVLSEALKGRHADDILTPPPNNC